MGKSTNIQGCDSTVNPTMRYDGCELRNPAAGVRKCYSGTLHDRYGGTSKGCSPTFEQVMRWPDRMATAAAWSDLTGTARPYKPWLDGLPRLIFVPDMRTPCPLACRSTSWGRRSSRPHDPPPAPAPLVVAQQAARADGRFLGEVASQEHRVAGQPVGRHPRYDNGEVPSPAAPVASGQPRDGAIPVRGAAARAARPLSGSQSWTG